MKSITRYLNESRIDESKMNTKNDVIQFVKNLGINGREMPAEDIGFKDSILINTPNELSWEMIGPYPTGGYLFLIKNKYNQKIAFTLDPSERIRKDEGFTILLKENTATSGKWNGTEVELDEDGVMRAIEMMAENPDKKFTRRDFK